MKILASIAAGLLVACAVECASAAEAAAEAPRAGEKSTYAKLALSPGTGYPDMVGLSVAISRPDVFEWEAGVAYFVLSGFTFQSRIGYPWMVARTEGRGFAMVLVPKVGVRYTLYEGECIQFGPGCQSGGSGHCGYRDIDAWGGNAALSIEPIFMFSERLGIVFQLTGGATIRFYGHDHQVKELCDDGDVTLTHGDEQRFRPDVRFAIGLIF